MNSYAVVGLGRFGAEVARQLHNLGCEVLAMDMSSELVQQVAQDVTHAVVADGQDKEVLKALGIRNMDCAIVAIGGDLAASVLVTMNMKELGVPYVVCKAHDEIHRRVLEKLGVEKIESLGHSFDPNFHNAVMHVDDEEKGENEIVEEFQKGFKMGDKVIRFSMVKVAN